VETDRDSKPQPAGALARRAQESITSRSATTSTPNSTRSWVGLERAYVIGIFKRFGELYGNVWNSQTTSQRDTEDKMQAWAKVLAGVEPKEIADALTRLPDMPPSAPQFRASCRQNRPATEAHKRFPPALPKPKSSKHKALAAISIIKHNLRKGTKEDPEYVPPKRVAADEFAFGRGGDYEKRKAEGFTQECKK